MPSLILTSYDLLTSYDFSLRFGFSPPSIESAVDCINIRSASAVSIIACLLRLWQGRHLQHTFHTSHNTCVSRHRLCNKQHGRKRPKHLLILHVLTVKRSFIHTGEWQDIGSRHVKQFLVQACGCLQVWSHLCGCAKECGSCWNNCCHRPRGPCWQCKVSGLDSICTSHTSHWWNCWKAFVGTSTDLKAADLLSQWVCYKKARHIPSGKSDHFNPHKAVYLPAR